MELPNTILIRPESRNEVVISTPLILSQHGVWSARGYRFQPKALLAQNTAKTVVTAIAMASNRLGRKTA